jgi:hypothetical protein
MKYAEARDLINDGDILLYGNDGTLISRVISWWTKSEFTHVGMAYRLGQRIFVIEAYPGQGVRMEPLSLRIPKKVKRMGFVWTDLADGIAMNDMMKPYSKWEASLAGLGFRTKDSNGRYICTKYVAEICKALGFEFECDYTPAAFDAYLSKDPEIVIE